MKSLIKLKINHKVETGKKVPWELIYLIKKDQIEISKRLFKYHLIVTSDVEVKEFLGAVAFERMETHGMTREEDFFDNLSPMKKLSELMNLKDYSLLVPILSKGSKAGKKSLRYFSSKQFRRAVNESSKSKSSKKFLEMPQVIISAGKDLEGHPCTNCVNLHAKILDEKACSLGSTLCLTNILLGKGSDFNTSLSIKEETMK